MSLSSANAEQVHPESTRRPPRPYDAATRRRSATLRLFVWRCRQLLASRWSRIALSLALGPLVWQLGKVTLETLAAAYLPVPELTSQLPEAAERIPKAHQTLLLDLAGQSLPLTALLLAALAYAGERWRTGDWLLSAAQRRPLQASAMLASALIALSTPPALLAQGAYWGAILSVQPEWATAATLKLWTAGFGQLLTAGLVHGTVIGALMLFFRRPLDAWLAIALLYAGPSWAARSAEQALAGIAYVPLVSPTGALRAWIRAPETLSTYVALAAHLAVGGTLLHLATHRRQLA